LIDIITGRGGSDREVINGIEKIFNFKNFGVVGFVRIKFKVVNKVV